MSEITEDNPVGENFAQRSVSALTVTPDYASLVRRGIVQLVDSFESTSLVMAPTANALKLVQDNAETKVAKASITHDYDSTSTTHVASANALRSGLATKANTRHSHEIDELPIASIDNVGVAMLNNTVVSTSVTQAATANAVKTAYDRGTKGIEDAAAAQETADSKWLYQTATTSRSGAVQLNNTVASTSVTEAATANMMRYVYNIAAAAIEKASISTSLTSTSNTTVVPSSVAKILNDQAASNLATAKAYTDALKSELLGDTPQETLDTFQEIAEAFAENSDALSAINAAIATKVAIASITNSIATTSSTLVASATAVKAAYDRGSLGVTNAATAQATADAKWTMVTATTARAGIVQLNNTVTSTSTTLAPTANAVKTAYDRGSLGVTNAATAQSTANTALNNAATAQSTANAKWTMVSATTSVAGIVQLSSSVSSTSTTLAATASAVCTAYNLAAAAVAKTSISTSVTSTSTSTVASSSAVKTAYDRGSTGITNAATAQTTADAALARSGGTMTGHALFNDNVFLKLGTGGDIEHFWNGSSYYTDFHTANTYWYIRNTSGSARFTFNLSSSIFTAVGNVGVTSDIRLKDDFKPIRNALSGLLTLEGVSYIRTDLDEDGKRHLGVKAQEVQKIFPELVNVDEKGFLSVSYGSFAPIFIEAIRTLNDKVDERDKRIEALEKDIEEIKKALLIM